MDPYLTDAVKLNIAIADDDEDSRTVLSSLLTSLGHSVVVCATNGRELIEACRAAPPDLVITDILMPDLDGLTASRVIGEELGIPLVVLSGVTSPDLIFRAERQAVLAYLVKPLARSNLEAVIALAVGERHRAAGEYRRDADDAPSPASRQSYVASYPSRLDDERPSTLLRGSEPPR